MPDIRFFKIRSKVLKIFRFLLAPVRDFDTDFDGNR